MQSNDRPIWLSRLYIGGENIPLKYFKIGEKLGFDIEDELFALKQEINELKQNFDL